MLWTACIDISKRGLFDCIPIHVHVASQCNILYINILGPYMCSCNFSDMYVVY